MGNMDWLRRNWPDLLIGIALVAVIAGIIATLISGGSFFPLGNRNASPTTSGQTTVTTPSTSSGTTTTTPSTSSSTAAGTESSGSPTTSTSGATTPSGSTETSTGTSTQPSGSIAVLPPTGSTSTDGATTGIPQSSGQESSSTTSTPETSTTGSQVTSTPATTTPSTGSTATTTATTAASTAAAGQGAPYRVSVGAFGSIENANRQADAFRAAGYPVFLGTQGSLNLVLVGPYDTEAQARSVADRIRADAALNVSDPTVYVLDGAESDSAQQTTTTTSSTTPTTPATSTTSPTTTTSSTATSSTTTSGSSAASVPTTSASGRYLQVGAYGSRDSSLPQRERVEGLGFVVSEREEDGLIKLLIGPFDSGGLEQAQARLTAAGVESFPR